MFILIFIFHNVATYAEKPLNTINGGLLCFRQYTEKFPDEIKQNSIVYRSRKLYKFSKNLTSPASLDDVVITLNAGLYVRS